MDNRHFHYWSPALSEVEVKINMLEEKVRLLARAMNLILMEGEELLEVEEVKSRLRDWLRRKEDEFIEVDKE